MTFFVLLCLIAALISINDCIYLRVEDRWLAYLAVAYGVLWIAEGASFEQLYADGMWAPLFFACGLPLFYWGLWGGGDVKLLALWAPLVAPNMWTFLFWTSLWGGVLALALLLWAKHYRALQLAFIAWADEKSLTMPRVLSVLLPSHFRQEEGHLLTGESPPPVPYGVAICLGGLWAVYERLSSL